MVTMRRLLGLLVLAAILVALPVSHLVRGGPPDRVRLCHIAGKGQQFIMDVPEPAVDGHLSHGDCLPFNEDCTDLTVDGGYDAEINEPGRPCECCE